MDEEEFKEIFGQLMSAVFYCHSKGLYHGDIKPENILITKDDKGKVILKLADFGMATKSLCMCYCGTPGYMSPEMELNLSYDTE